MSKIRSSVALAFPTGDGHLQREAELNRFAGEIEHTGGSKQDPGRPGRERGDRSELLAFLVGVAGGAVIGTVAAIISDVINIFAGVIGGMILAGLVGLWVGGRIRRRSGAR